MVATEREVEFFEPDRVIGGRYKIVGLLGKGAVGAVYRAEHVELRRPVALKVLLEKFFENERMRSRFLREARTSASIRHPGVVEVFDLGTEGEVTYIAMELLEGEELFNRIKKASPLPIRFVAEVGYDLADAVAAAHERGVVHRDLKPQNVFLSRQGRRQDVVKVLDFGLAKAVDQGSPTRLTKTGEVFGTPNYIAPEQLRSSKDADSRVDVYSMGVILFEALTGVPPFREKSFYDLVVKIATAPPPPIESLRADVPPELAQVVHRAMAKRREHRFQSAAELRDALESFL